MNDDQAASPDRGTYPMTPEVLAEVLSGDGVTLRPLRVEDADEVDRRLPRPADASGSCRACPARTPATTPCGGSLRARRPGSPRRGGIYAIADPADRPAARRRAACSPGREGTAEIGYWVAPWARRRGGGDRGRPHAHRARLRHRAWRGSTCAPNPENAAQPAGRARGRVHPRRACSAAAARTGTAAGTTCSSGPASPTDAARPDPRGSCPTCPAANSPTA